MTDQDDRVLIDCENFLQGKCIDSKCVYRHCHNLFHPRVVCKYWIQFMCIDVKCRFLHPSEESLAKLQHVTSTPAGSNKPTPLCKFFGRCKKLGCPFLHDLPEASVSRHPSIGSSSKPAEVVDDAGLSRSNSNSSKDSLVVAGHEVISPTVGTKRDRGVEILQRYSVTAIAEETASKKIKSILPTTVIASVQEELTNDDFIALGDS